MPGVSREGDFCSGHADFPPRPSDTGSANVTANGRPLLRQFDHFAIHCNPHECHDGFAALGSSTVFCNGEPVMRVGDPISCGSVCANGSATVFCG